MKHIKIHLTEETVFQKQTMPYLMNTPVRTARKSNQNMMAKEKVSPVLKA